LFGNNCRINSWGHIGLGNIVTPIGFIGGIAVDIAILRQFFGKRKDESKSTPKQILSCCNIFSHLNSVRKENH
jgi:hypothetical protein